MDSRWHVRPAVPADYDTYLRLFPELSVDDPLPERARWEADLLPSMLVVELAGPEGPGAPIAYSRARAFGDVGYVLNVVVDPAWRGRGVGGAMMEAVAGQMRAAGCARWCLNVRIDNVPAIRLYERWGMARVYESAVLSLAWDSVAALPREGAAMETRPIDPAEDGALEAAFSIIPGRIADLRTKGLVLLRLVDPAHPGRPAGVACFDPGFRGAFPFAVARPALAASLLEGMRPHARPGDARVQVVVERDAALVTALREVGAIVRHQMFHMEGDIPGA